ncbi:MAG: capsule biosynthesis GfcC family protein, partial [Mariprofundaceae bacterium]|nr:capsule biosynthesis GfcC family protein [Mariprofundaceae bacterium]
QKSLASAKRVLIDMRQVQATGRLVIQLRDVAALQQSDFDLALQGGDHLYVPQKPDQVLVMGQVYNSIAMLYQKGMDVDDYLDAAGGVTRMADEDRTYVVRANGQVDALSGWWSSRVHPGDTIIVPEQLETFYLLDSLLDWSKVLMNVGVSAATMKTIGVF